MGFTLMELLVAIGIFGILAAVAIPGFSAWLPNYRLKSAARDVYSHMQLAKMGAVKQNKAWAVVFDPGMTPGRYSICSDKGANDDWDGPGGDDVVEKTVDFANYAGAIDFGHGNASDPMGSTFGGDDITYNSPVNTAVFNPKGTCNAGYVYLQNRKNTTHCVGTRSSGVILLRKWSGADWE